MNKGVFKANRFLAALIDGLIMFLLLSAICFAPALTFFREISEGKYISSSIFWFAFSIFGSFLVWILYLSVSTLIFRKSTLGMRIMHLVFVSMKDEDVKFSSILFREATVVVCFVFSLGFSVLSDSIAVINSKDGKSIYDIFSSIKVVPDDVD